MTENTACDPHTVMRCAAAGVRTRLMKGMSSINWRLAQLSDARMALLACVLLAAAAGLTGGSAAAKSDEQQYRLASGDRIAVTVMGQTELTGAFTIDNAGEIHLPLLGPFRVAGMTTAECQKRVQDELAKGYLRQPAVFVRVEEARPIHIFGDVTNPGSYKFQYGSIVKTAIAQAGGYGSIAKAAAAMPDLVLAQERVYSLGAKRDALVIKIARLEAQLEAAKRFTAPETTALSRSEAERLIALEQRALEVKVDSFNSQRNLLRSQRPQLVTEDEAMGKQIAAEKKQIDLLGERSSQYAALKAKGLARSKELVDHEITLSGKQSNVWRLEAERSRLRLAINDLDAKINAVGETYKEQTMTEVGVVQAQLAEVEASLPSARDLRSSRMLSVGVMGETSPAFAISITRTRNGAASLMEATEMTGLEPGDIIEVRLMRRSALEPTAPVGSIAPEPRVSQ